MTEIRIEADNIEALNSGETLTKVDQGWNLQYRPETAMALAMVNDGRSHTLVPVEVVSVMWTRAKYVEDPATNKMPGFVPITIVRFRKVEE